MLVLDTRTVCELLSIPAPGHIEDDPEPRAQEVVVWYPGWTFDEMTAIPVLQPLIKRPDERKSLDSITMPVPSGYYALRFPAGEDPEEQDALLRDGERPAPVRLAAFTLAVHLLTGDPPLMPENLTARCGDCGGGSRGTVAVVNRTVLISSMSFGKTRVRMVSARQITAVMNG